MEVSLTYIYDDSTVINCLSLLRTYNLCDTLLIVCCICDLKVNLESRLTPKYLYEGSFCIDKFEKDNFISLKFLVLRLVPKHTNCFININ